MAQTVEQGDAFELLAELPEDFAHAALIDYPWDFSYSNRTDRFDYDSTSKENPLFDYPSEERVDELFEEVSRVLVDGGYVICFADDEFQDRVRSEMRACSGFTFRRNWVWSDLTMRMGYYGRVSHYPIPVATVGETERYVKNRGTFYYVGMDTCTSYPTAKPWKLAWQLLYEPVLQSGDRLLEPFCGSGPGAVVANIRDLDYWGCDVDSKAVKLTQERLQGHHQRY